MVIKYVGQKKLPYILQTPIPFIAKSEANGELVFTPTCTVTNDEWAAFLLDECGDAFELVEGSLPDVVHPARISDEERAKRFEEKVSATLGKKFRGKAAKWNALSFLKRHHLTARLGLKKLTVSGHIMHWEVVPIAMAEVMAGDAGITSIPSTQEEGQEDIDHERDSNRESIEV